MPDPSDLILTIDLFVVGEFFRVCARVGGAGVKLCAVVFLPSTGAAMEIFLKKSSLTFQTF